MCVKYALGKGKYVLLQTMGERTSVPPETSFATRKSSVKAALGATEDNSFSGEQLGVGGEFCCCLTAAEEVPGVVAVKRHDHPLTLSPLSVASQGPTSADRRAIIVLLWPFPGKSELLADLLLSRRAGKSGITFWPPVIAWFTQSDLHRTKVSSGSELPGRKGG